MVKIGVEALDSQPRCLAHRTGFGCALRNPCRTIDVELRFGAIFVVAMEWVEVLPLPLAGKLVRGEVGLGMMSSVEDSRQSIDCDDQGIYK